MKNFQRRLAQLRGIACERVLAVEYEEPSTDTIYSVGTSVRFADGTKLEAQFWRLAKEGRQLVSIFDHRQRYGGSTPIDALRFIHDELAGKHVVDATMDEGHGGPSVSVPGRAGP